MKVTDIAFFAYAVSDLPAAREFYEGFIGLRPNSEYNGSTNPHWIEYDIGSATLGIGCAPTIFEPSSKGALAALEVEDFESALQQIKDKGVPIVMGPHDLPSCRMVMVADPDGNRLTLHQRKKANQ